jgi:hypothetical protein
LEASSPTLTLSLFWKQIMNIMSRDKFNVFWTLYCVLIKILGLSWVW